MRFPRTHSFLKWLGAGLIASPLALLATFAALAENYPRLRSWGEGQFEVWWPVVSAWWFVLGFFVFLIGYIAAIVYTGSARGEQMDEKRGNDEGGGHIIGGSVEGNRRHGFNFRSGNVTLQRVKVKQNEGDGIRIGKNANVQMEDVESSKNRGDGLHVEGEDDDN